MAIPAEGKYTTETEYTTELAEYKKLPVATDTEADRDDEIIDDEIPDDEIQDDEIQDDEIPDDEIPGDEIPDDEIVLPTATPTEAIPVEEVLPVATPTTLMMAPVMLAAILASELATKVFHLFTI